MQTIELNAEQTYKLEIKGVDLVYITTLLSDQPYKEVNPLISSISSQVTNQLNNNNNG